MRLLDLKNLDVSDVATKAFSAPDNLYRRSPDTNYKQKRQDRRAADYYRESDIQNCCSSQNHFLFFKLRNVVCSCCPYSSFAKFLRLRALHYMTLLFSQLLS